ncbi:hypothetical protein ERO13_D13G237340v2 [Gossypium hirsutum]|nr:hypothetical protein ERO13_D13G237340v2 [Gossypium hirsutum]
MAKALVFSSFIVLLVFTITSSSLPTNALLGCFKQCKRRRRRRRKAKFGRYNCYDGFGS